MFDESNKTAKDFDELTEANRGDRGKERRRMKKGRRALALKRQSQLTR